MLGFLDFLRAVRGTVTVALRRGHPWTATAALALPFVVALGGLFWFVGGDGESADDAASRAGREERTASTHSADPEGSAPDADTATPPTTTAGAAAGDTVGPVDDQGRALDPAGPGSPPGSSGTTGSPGSSGSSGSAGSPGSTTPPGGSGANHPSWSSTTTTTPRGSSTTTRPPAPTTTTTAPPGLLDALLDLLGL